MSSKIAIVSQRIVTPDGQKHLAVLIEGDRIANLVEPNNIPSNFSIQDYGNSIVMPGIIDTHVHVNEPGRTDWEGFETATKAAAVGGITTIIDMPLNSSPVTTTEKAFQEKLNSTSGKLWIDCGFYGGIVSSNIEDIRNLAKLGVLGYKSFLVHSGIDEYPNVDEEILRKVMPVLTEIGLPLLVHSELENNVDLGDLDPRQYSTYLKSRPRSWENNAIEMLIQLVHEYQTRVHIIHLSSSEALTILKTAKEKNLPITVETCPHYLHFNSETIDDGHTQFKCAPPIREKVNQEKLWNGLRDGIIDTIGSDHSPCEPSLKNQDTGNFMTAWGGISSVQFTLSTIWTEIKKRGMNVDQMVEWLCHAPSRLVGLDRIKGKLAPGYHADIVVWDPDELIEIEDKSIYHKHKLTPYHGEKLQGKVIATFVRGQMIYNHGILIETPVGEIILDKRSI